MATQTQDISPIPGILGISYQPEELLVFLLSVIWPVTYNFAIYQRVQRANASFSVLLASSQSFVTACSLPNLERNPNLLFKYQIKNKELISAMLFM